MQTVGLAIDAPGSLDRTTELLRRGGILAFPTDTVYGVGAHAFLPEAVQALYRVKLRPTHLPIPLLLPDAEAMAAVCDDVPSIAWRLAARFWPGGLSLILRRSSAVPDAVTASGPTVAVRVPDQPFVRALCRRLGAPLAATSANRHRHPPPVTADEVRLQLGGRIALLLDGGPCAGGQPSTLLDLTVSPPEILRPGPITADQLRGVVGTLTS